MQHSVQRPVRRPVRRLPARGLSLADLHPCYDGEMAWPEWDLPAARQGLAGRQSTACLRFGRADAEEAQYPCAFSDVDVYPTWAGKQRGNKPRRVSGAARL